MSLNRTAGQTSCTHQLGQETGITRKTRSSLWSVRHTAILRPRIEQVLKPSYWQTLFPQPSYYFVEK